MPHPHNIFTHMHTYHMLTQLHAHTGLHLGRVWARDPLVRIFPPPPLRICKFYASLVMPPKLFHTGGLKLPLLAALGLSNLTPEQMALLGPALSSQLGNSKLL